MSLSLFHSPVKYHAHLLPCCKAFEAAPQKAGIVHAELCCHIRKGDQRPGNTARNKIKKISSNSLLVT